MTTFNVKLEGVVHNCGDIDEAISRVRGVLDSDSYMGDAEDVELEVVSVKKR